MYVPHCVQSSIVGYWGWFYLLALGNKTAVNTCVQVPVLRYFEYIPRSGIAGSSLYVQLLEEHQTLFHSAVFICTMCKRDLFFPFLILPRVHSLSLSLPQKRYSGSPDCSPAFRMHLFLPAPQGGEPCPGLC